MEIKLSKTDGAMDRQGSGREKFESSSDSLFKTFPILLSILRHFIKPLLACLWAKIVGIVYFFVVIRTLC